MKVMMLILILFCAYSYARPPEKLIKVEEFCISEKDQYLIQCPGTSLTEMSEINPTNIKFCGNYERLCPKDAGRNIISDLSQQIPIRSGPNVPMIIPPQISEDTVQLRAKSTTATPATTRIAQIPLVIGNNGAMSLLTNQVQVQKPMLTPDVIKTCTPDCTASQCTKECKCANTEVAVYSKCNPPSSSDMVGVCQAWYAECPMFKQLQYGDHS